ncbi:MAG: hypothetical protein ACOCPX_00375 [Halapricum sp.]
MGRWSESPGIAPDDLPSGLVERVLHAFGYDVTGVDLIAVCEQVEATRPALPSLRHYLITARYEP